MDDHDFLLSTTRWFIQRQFPLWKVEKARTGEEAIDQVRLHAPDVVIMDVELPGISGLEATRQIKIEAPTTQVLLWSISEAPGQRDAALAAGAAAFLLKDASADKLVAILSKLLPSA